MEPDTNLIDGPESVGPVAVCDLLPCTGVACALFCAVNQYLCVGLTQCRVCSQFGLAC